MNYIATVNTPAHGTISVTYADIEKNILGAWREEETIQLSGKEKQQIAKDIICNRRFTRVFEKAYVVNSGFGTFVFPVRSGRFCQSKLTEFASQIAIWIKTQSSFDFSDDEAIAQGMRIANNAIKCKNITYAAGVDSWKLFCANFMLNVYASNRIHILAGKREGLETPLSFRPPAPAGKFRNGQKAIRATDGKRPENFRETAGVASWEKFV